MEHEPNQQQQQHHQEKWKIAQKIYIFFKENKSFSRVNYTKDHGGTSKKKLYCSKRKPTDQPTPVVDQFYCSYGAWSQLLC